MIIIIVMIACVVFFVIILANFLVKQENMNPKSTNIIAIGYINTTYITNFIGTPYEKIKYEQTNVKL